MEGDFTLDNDSAALMWVLKIFLWIDFAYSSSLKMLPECEILLKIMDDKLKPKKSIIG